MRRAVLVTALGGLAWTACAYFNAFYNAERVYAEAEAARARGDVAAAAAAYATSIEKAARSLRRDPDGRWADDALYLIARARFRRGEFAEARAALRRVLERTRDPAVQAGGLAYLGAVEARGGAYDAAVEHLDAAVSAAGAETRLGRFARLWRARVRFDTGRPEAGWTDLAAAARGRDDVARAARIEQLERAVAHDAPVRADTALVALLGDPEAHRRAPVIRAVLGRAVERWGAERTRALLSAAESARWPAPARRRLLLHRARLAAAAGDTAAALAGARRLAEEGDGETAAAAALAAARWHLARAEDLGDVRAVRPLLQTAAGTPEGRRLEQAVDRLEQLLEAPGLASRPLARFAAAELARDVLGGRRFARRLFLDYVEAAPTAPWAGKALLAAAGLATDPGQAARLRRRIDARRDNVYVAALRGPDPGPAYTAAERALADSLALLRSQVEHRLRRAARPAAGGESAEAECAAAADTAAGGGLGLRVQTPCTPADTTTGAGAVGGDTTGVGPDTTDARS